MKLYAQHGFSDGGKILKGVAEGYIDGVIYSPRDIAFARLCDELASVRKTRRDADRFFDPQYYAGYNVSDPEARLGRLETCDEYQSFFRSRTRRQLEGSRDLLRKDIEDCLTFQRPLSLSGVISPNILISRSFDSIDAVVSKNFIREAGRVHTRLRCAKPLYVTLAVSREALMDRAELFSFLEDITILDPPPRGFYVLVAARSGDARTDIFNADVIAGWMLMNRSLSVNGFEVVNGYSDVLTPFLGIAGATAGATGWWSNLRVFSLSRFLPAGGGRLPIPRYLSTRLLNRISYVELSQLVGLRETGDFLPEIRNGLATDALYPAKTGYEPDRADEVLQSWEAIRCLCSDLSGADPNESLTQVTLLRGSVCWQ